MANDQSPTLLQQWYDENKRNLPWRLNRDPYRIWISETMLQQTTTTAVIPYFERFLTRFPTLKSLADASSEDVLKHWAGLGYYSRAHNLHKAAKALSEMPNFPQTYRALIELPGFGPYTSRAVSSLAFSEPVGVLDGNVIRVLSRKFNLKLEWWRPAVRQIFQEKADQLVAGLSSHILNQALMELGSQICTPQNPKCVMCPWVTTCLAKKAKTIASLPLKKPKRAREFWELKFNVRAKNGRVLLAKNTKAPFLRGGWLLPNETKKLNAKPKKFDFRHSITHHDIFVTVQNDKKSTKTENQKWVAIKNLSSVAPYSLVQKAWATFSRSTAKNLSLIILLCFSISLFSCSSAKKKSKHDTSASHASPNVSPKNLVETDNEPVGPYTPITTAGENRAPHFSPKGDRLLYVSAKRAAHANPQLYELDINSGHEHRLTFQDGEVFDGVYDHSGTHIVYSSSTDEIKENPQYLIDAISKIKNPVTKSLASTGPISNPQSFTGDPLPPTDLYEAEINKSDIHRLTHSFAFDGEMSFNPKRDELVFVSATSGHLGLYRLDMKSGSPQRLSVSSNIQNPAQRDEWPQFSGDGKNLAWVHIGDAQNSEIWVSSANGLSPRKLTGGDGVYWSPVWLPGSDEILFSSNHDNKDVFEFYAIKSDGSCLRKVSENAKIMSRLGKKSGFRAWQMQFDPSGNRVAFVSDITGLPEIYVWNAQVPPCAKVTAKVELPKK